MNMNIQSAMKGSAILLAALIASGCAATASNMDELSSRVDALAADVARAQSAADAAGATASEARQMSSGAQSTANQALNAANQAQACCDATNEKIDRMFEKGTFVNYLPYFSRSLFGSRFFHSCTFFGIISSVAAGVEQLRAKDELNQESVTELNLRIAQEMGFACACQ